jgi:C_GCAxxG_C_C family probable redox protein
MMPDGDRITELTEDALNFFRNGLYCSEAILKSFKKNGYINAGDEVLNIATSFGVGIGASKCCCGSLTGGVLVLSFLFGRNAPEISDKNAMDTSARLYEEFKNEFGASCCKVLTRSVEWGTPGHHKFCEKYVKRAVEITYNILIEFSNTKKKAV